MDDEDIFNMNQHILTDLNKVDENEFHSNYARSDEEDDYYTLMKQEKNAVRSQKTKSKKRKTAERKVVSQ